MFNIYCICVWVVLLYYIFFICMLIHFAYKRRKMRDCSNLTINSRGKKTKTNTALIQHCLSLFKGQKTVIQCSQTTFQCEPLCSALQCCTQKHSDRIRAEGICLFQCALFLVGANAHYQWYNIELVKFLMSTNLDFCLGYVISQVCEQKCVGAKYHSVLTV